MAVKERPILFSGEMVRAIIDGRKSQTRRVVKPQPPEDGSLLAVGRYHPTVIRRGEEEPGPEVFGATWCDGEFALPCPYGQPGDRLWVRETWGHDWYDDGNTRAWKRLVYRADPDAQPMDNGTPMPWRPSIHMPRAASRITLEVTAVRVERLQDMAWRDALAEGVEPEVCSHQGAGEYGCTDCMDTGIAEDPVPEFRDLWDSLNVKRGYGWDVNPWVWVIEFKPADSPALSSTMGAR